MRLAGALRAAVTGLFRRGRIEQEMEGEIRAHIRERAEDLRRAGVAREEAERRARMEFGGVEKCKEECREALALSWLDHLWRDLRFAWRMSMKSPGFTAAAVIALALGIGADTAMYSIVNGALTWDLGLDNRDRIVIVSSTNKRHDQDWTVSYPDFRDFRGQVESLAGLAAYRFVPVNLSDQRAVPERYYCVEMSANGFSVVQHKPLLGRDFIAADEQPGATPVLMLGYHVWRDRYAEDPGIVGKTLRVDEVSRVVIGVMPPGRRFPEETDLWVPLVPDARREKRDNRALMVFGRLGDGVKLAKARSELEGLAARLAAQYPDTNRGVTAKVRPIMEITGVYYMKPLFLALFVAVGFVLLIACADVANMLLGRAAERGREISIRVAIGAGRIPILRQVLLESVVLSVAGGFFGLLVAVGGLRWFDRGMGTQVKPIWLHLSLDRNALFYLGAVSIGTGLLFGLAPALRLLKTDVSAALKDGGSGVAGSKFGLRASNALVGFQMALCVLLLAGAGLMIRSAVSLYGTPIGVSTANVLTMRVNLPEVKYKNPESWIGFHENLAKRLDGLPGVEMAGAASQLPLGNWIPFSAEFEGKNNDAVQRPEVGGLVVSNNYFEMMRVEARRGRLFLEMDGQAGPPVAVVNETFAEKFWPGEKALGKRLRLVQESAPPGPWLLVVGVVPDVLQNFREHLKHDPLVYLPLPEEPQRQMFLLARTAVPPATLADAFRREVQRMDANLAVYEVRTLEDRIAESRLTVTLFGAMCTVFAAVATLLATIGLYAVTLQSVNQRTQEIGLRIALGATRRDIVGLVFRLGLRPIALGLVVGLLLAFAATRVLRSLLRGVSPHDPAVFAGTVVVLLAAAVIGCAVPTRRAMRVDPLVALRYE